jgi:hypothetical protein
LEGEIAMKLKSKFIVCDKCKMKFFYPTDHGCDDYDTSGSNKELKKWKFCPFCGREIAVYSCVQVLDYNLSDPEEILDSLYSFMRDRGFYEPLKRLTLSTLWDFAIEKYKFIQDLDAQLAYLEAKDAWRNKIEPW